MWMKVGEYIVWDDGTILLCTQEGIKQYGPEERGEFYIELANVEKYVSMVDQAR